MRERRESEVDSADELTGLNKKFGSGVYGSVPVCETQPTVIDITASFYYQPAVIIYITVGLLENSTVIAFLLTNRQ